MRNADNTKHKVANAKSKATANINKTLVHMFNIF